MGSRRYSTPTRDRSSRARHSQRRFWRKRYESAWSQIRHRRNGRGCYLDNIFVERLWRTVKQENIYLHDYESVSSVRRGLSDYFRFYNNERLHQGLGNMCPAEKYFLTRKEEKCCQPGKLASMDLDDVWGRKWSGGSALLSGRVDLPPVTDCGALPPSAPHWGADSPAPSNHPQLVPPYFAPDLV